MTQQSEHSLTCLMTGSDLECDDIWIFWIFLNVKITDDVQHVVIEGCCKQHFPIVVYLGASFNWTAGGKN